MNYKTPNDYIWALLRERSSVANTTGSSIKYKNEGKKT